MAASSYVCKSFRWENGRRETRVKLLFFTTNLHSVTSSQISTYKKINLPLTTTVYLVYLPLDVNNRLKQTKVYLVLFCFAWKETTQQTLKKNKPLKVAAAKFIFSNVYVIGNNCFDRCFLFHMITGRHYFS